MNIILNPSQTNTKRGDISLLGAADLTGKENQVLKVTNVGGVAKFAVPAAITDMALFVCASGDVAANVTSAERPNAGDTARVMVSGAVNPGDLLSVDPNNYGQLYKAGAGAGATYYLFIALEAAAANGLCLVTPVGPIPVTL